MANDVHRSTPPEALSGKAVLEAFLRHKKKVAALALAIIASTALILIFAPRKYRSEAKLFLQVGRESVRLDPTATTGSMIALQQSGRDTEIATAMEVLRSRAIVERTVDALTPEVVLAEGSADSGESKNRSPVADVVLKPVYWAIGVVKSLDPISKREEAIIQIERNLEVDAEHDSTVISLTYDAETAALAKQMLQKVVEVYQEEHVRLHQTKGSKPFFVAQRAELEKKLVSAEKAYRDAKVRMGVASIDARRSTLENRLASLEQSRNSVIQQASAAEAKIASLKEHIAEMPETLHTSTTIVPNSSADQLRAQLYSLQVNLMNLEAKYNEDHPIVQSARQQVAEAKRMAAEESDSRQETVDSLNENHRTLSLALAEAESKLAGLQAELTELNGQRTVVQAELLKTNDFEVELLDLERARQLANSNFHASATKFEQARIDEELDAQRITNVAVAQEATLAEKPISPSKLILAALSMLLLFGGTTAMVLACEKLNSRIANEAEAEQILGLPVLATVPEGRVYGSLPKAMA
jgi:uncharacterized protein involved in exopolysaccharide biosynthesis